MYGINFWIVNISCRIDISEDKFLLYFWDCWNQLEVLFFIFLEIHSDSLFLNRCTYLGSKCFFNTILIGNQEQNSCLMKENIWNLFVVVDIENLKSLKWWSIQEHKTRFKKTEKNKYWDTSNTFKELVSLTRICFCPHLLCGLVVTMHSHYVLFVHPLLAHFSQLSLFKCFHSLPCYCTLVSVTIPLDTFNHVDRKGGALGLKR